MLNKLSAVEEKYAETERLLSDPATVSNPVEYARLMKEYKAQTPIIDTYRVYKQTMDEAEQAKMLIRYLAGLDS